MKGRLAALWAKSPATQRREPQTEELLSGFPCGPADRQLFNELMYRLSQGEAEVVEVITRAGLVPDENDQTQLWQALQSLIGATAEPSRYGNFGNVYLTKSGTALLLHPENGYAIYIEGAYRDVPSAGVQLPAPGGGAATYHIYAYWTGSAVALEQDSLNGPARDTNTGLWTKSTDVTRTYVGTARSSSGGAWQDAPLVASWFNPKPRSYSANNNSQSVTSSSSWQEVAGTRVSFVTCHDQPITVIGGCSMRRDTAGIMDAFYNLGFDAVSPAGTWARFGNSDFWVPGFSAYTTVLSSPAYRYATSIWKSDGTNPARIDNITTLVMIHG